MSCEDVVLDPQKWDLSQWRSLLQVLASMSTRRVGQKLQGSVLTSLTALSTAKDGLDKNVDLIFEDVFGRDFLRDIVNLDMDDFF